MNPLLTLLVIISSVVSNQNYREIYESLCKSKVNISSLQNLIKDNRFGISDEDCDNSIGFHFNTKLCQSLDPQTTTSSTHNFSAFISDETYLYIYLYPKVVFTPESKHLKNINTLLDFSSWGKGYLTKYSPQYLFVLWIKEKKIFKSNQSYKIEHTYNESIKTEANLILGQRTDEQLIFKWNLKTSQLNISFASESSINISDRITIRDSYVITCGQFTPTFSFKNCKPVEKSQQIRCECKDDITEEAIIVVLLLIWCTPLILSVKPIMDLFIDNPKADKTVFQITHNCNERNYKYKYSLSLRFSKISSDFDLKKVTIDVEFFTDNNESVGKNLFFNS